MRKCVDCLISGRNLQYRDLIWINRLANSLSLKGTTFFKNDGSIKIVVEGEEEDLLFFIKKVKNGRFFLSIFSTIENFSTVWTYPKNEFDNFAISEPKD
jgi:acylphosphatase